METTPKSPAPITVSASAHPSLRTWVSLFVVALMVWMLIRYGTLLVEVLSVVFGAYLLSLAILPAANYAQSRGIHPRLTVIAIYLSIFAVLGLLIWLAAPYLEREMGHLRTTLPMLLEEIEQRLSVLPIIGDIDLSAYTITESTEDQLPTVANYVMQIAGDLFHIIADLFIVLVLAFLFVTDRRLGTDLLFTWVPKDRRWRVRTIFANTSQRLSRWLVAQVTLALFFGVLFGLGLLLLGLPFALTIALIGAVLEFVPFLGGAVSLTLASLVALTTFQPIKVIGVVVVYFVVNWLQLHVLQPYLYSRAVDVHPAAILIALLVGVQAGGVLGALFAVPVAVVLVTLLDEIEKPGEMPVEEPDPNEPTLADKLPGEVGSEDAEAAD